MAGGPWEGLHVLEIGQHIPAAYCAKLLADLGADVVKIERPGTGDPLRTWGPFKDDIADPEASAMFQYLNTNKRSVALSLRDDADAVLRLVAASDVVIENMRPGALAALGLGFDAMRAANPRIVVVRITSFGQSGPYADLEASELTIQAAGGFMMARGTTEREPVMGGGRVVEFAGGAYAAVGALTGVLASRALSDAVEVDVSLQECTAVMQPFGMMQAAADRWAEVPAARSPRGSRPGILACKDGYVGINALTAQQWSDTCQLLEIQDFEKRPTATEPAAAAELYERIQPWLDARTVNDIVEQGQLYRIPTAPLNNGKTLLESDQFRAREFYVKHPWADFTQPGFPYRFGKTPPTLRTKAPSLGEHTAEVLGAPTPISGAAEQPRGRDGSDERHDLLRGLRVLDLTTFWSGPAATQYLASFGADVIKVESIQRPDGFRPSAAPQPGTHDQWYELSLIWQGGNLDKRNVTLDLTRPEGRELFDRLLQTSDIVIENFSPRVVENFGITYDTMRKVKPDVIFVRSPGFGLEGPWRNWVGWAMAFEQASGIAWSTGYEDAAPMVLGGACDGIVAMHTVVAILSALEHRRRTGEGQEIEVAQVEVAACLSAEQVIDYSLNGRIQGRTGNRKPSLVQGAYRCRGENRWVAITVRNDRDWTGLRGVLGLPDDSSLRTQAQRIARHDDIDAAITAWTRDREHTEVGAALQAARVPAADLISGAQLHTDPHIVERKMLQTLEHPINGAHAFPVWPMTYSFGPRRCHYSPSATLGQHNDEILGGELGLGDEEMQELRDKQVIGDRALHW